MYHRFPNGHIPLMHAQGQGFKHEDDGMKTGKAKPCHDQPICNARQQTPLSNIPSQLKTK